MTCMGHGVPGCPWHHVKWTAKCLGSSFASGWSWDAVGGHLHCCIPSPGISLRWQEGYRGSIQSFTLLQNPWFANSSSTPVLKKSIKALRGSGATTNGKRQLAPVLAMRVATKGDRGLSVVGLLGGAVLLTWSCW